MSRLILSTLLAFTLFGCATHPAGTAVAVPKSSERLSPQRAAIDSTVAPCDDFYEYATGRWRKETAIPAAYPEWGRFDELADRNRDVLHQLLESASGANSPNGSNSQKVGDFYASCMASEAIERAGLDPLRPELQRIDAVANLDSLRAEIAHLQSIGVRSLFLIGSDPDFNDSSQVVLHILQSGLGLPDRDYYFKDDEKSKNIRNEYQKHVSRMFRLGGEDEASASASAATVLRMETALAAASMTRTERRDPKQINNVVTLADLQALTPDFDWSRYLAEVGSPALSKAVIHQPKFAREVEHQLTATPLPQWKTFLRWRLLHTYAPRLSTAFAEEDFAFNDRTLQGSTELLPRWKRCLAMTDEALGEALGEQYVAHAFPPAAKARAQSMVSNLIAALHSDLPTLQWMSTPTRQQAEAKLSAFAQKIGYPDKWIDYAPLTVSRDRFLENVMRGETFAIHHDLERIGKPLDRSLWEMTPPTVNAYYNPSRNEIVFPAGILQAPFFDASADDAYNYGAIGSVIGHEMTHGFDDSGAQFDAAGNLKNWWSEEDLKNFQTRSSCVTSQYGGYSIEGEHLNGKLVTGESIADIGGVALAYAAYQKSLEGKERQVIDGFTPEQRFFIGFAQIWATNSRPEYVRLRLTTDPHPPERYRVNGVVTNLPEFAKAFSCAASSAMNPPDAKRCKLW